ncbi:MAG: winged helix-turn-helix transcriptional regulator [Anaerolineaceae bacterium]|nr:winged helix-turn-helix transcriptional regulator [Anaerolineaceae bacterium]
MPVPDEDQLQLVQTTPIRVALEPAYNNFNDLLLISRFEERSGLSDWVYQVGRSLTGNQLHDLCVIVEGLHYAVFPSKKYSSFPHYLEGLSSINPERIRRKLFEAYFECKCKVPENDITLAPDFDTDKVIASLSSDFDAFLDFLKSRFPPDRINEDVERNVHQLIKNPSKMQSFVIDNLRKFWDIFLEEEWLRVQPLLNETIMAFHQVDFSKLSKLDALMLVVEQEFQDEQAVNKLLKDKQLILVPSAHLGPYHYKFKSPDKIVFLFGARTPQGLPARTPHLSRSELLMRFNALADDNRMEILKYVSTHGEISSHEIMNQFNLSQSSASRHLAQLSATGFLNERRAQGSKQYSLNPERVDDTFQAMDMYLSTG